MSDGTSDDEHRAARQDPAYWEAVEEELRAWFEAGEDAAAWADLMERVDRGEFDG